MILVFIQIPRVPMKYSYSIMYDQESLIWLNAIVNGFYTLTSKTKYGSRFLKIVKLDQPARFELFCLLIDEIFLASERAGQILSETLVPR